MPVRAWQVSPLWYGRGPAPPTLRQSGLGPHPYFQKRREKKHEGFFRIPCLLYTSGSGKSLTMVMLAKYLLMELAPCNPKVVVVTDRKELDRQISTTFAHTRLNPATASSGRNLVKLLQSGKADVVTTIINKFNTAEKLEHKDLSGDVFLLVDESHPVSYTHLDVYKRQR